MELRIVESLEELRELRAEFLALERRIPNATPYLTHRWVTAFWASFRDEICCRALCVFDEGRLVGWLPLAWTRGLRRFIPPRVIRPVGNRWGILNVPCDADRPDVVSFLLRGLKNPSFPRWDMIVLGPLRGTAETISIFRRSLLTERFVFEMNIGRNPFVRLDGTWEAFLGRQSRNFRKTMRKRLEGVELGGRFRIRHEVDPSRERICESVVAVSVASWQGSSDIAVGASKGGRAFYESVQEPEESFQVHLTTIESEGTCIAYLVGMLRSGVYYAFDTGFLPEHRELSPGLVIHFALLQELCKRGAQELDFGFDAAYKERFAPEFRTYHDFKIFSGNATRSLWRFGQFVRRARRKEG